MNNKYTFLKAVLGSRGAEAMGKAASQSEAVDSVILPRTILSWINMISPYGYDGPLPGQEHASINFSKSESGFEGDIAIGGELYPFEKASLTQMAAMVAVALETDIGLSKGVKDVDIARLGKSIDVLVRTTQIDLVKKELGLEKKIKIEQGAAIAPGAPVKSPQASAKLAGAPVAPGSPQAHAKPSKEGMKVKSAAARIATQKPKAIIPGRKPKPKGLPGRHPAMKLSERVHVTLDNLNAECSECGLKLVKSDKFVGCLCLRGLMNNVELSKTEDKYFLSFKGLDEDAISVVLETMGVK